MAPEVTQTETVKLVTSAADQPSIDGFELLALIGSGGMGCVYKARQLSSNATFAIKVLHPELARDPVNVRRFEQEAQACGKLDNPHVVNVYSSGTTTDGRPYLVMDYICGSGLNEVLSEEGYLEQSRFVEIFSQVCEALKLAHAQSIIHRDLKPSNIMLVRNETSNDFVKVVDFGIARTLQQTAKDGPRVTQTGDLMGSPTYMSPEQCLGQKLDTRSDIYSLGVVMYEALTGKLPFEAENAVQVLLKQINDQPEPLSSIRPDFNFGRRVERLVLTALQKNPDDRWQNIEEVINELKGIAAGAPLPANTPVRTTRATKLSEKNSKRILPLAFAVSAGGGIAICGCLLLLNVRSLVPIDPMSALTIEQKVVALQYAEKYDDAGKLLQADIDASMKKGLSGDDLVRQYVKAARTMGQTVRVDNFYEPSPMGGFVQMPDPGETALTRWKERFLQEALKSTTDTTAAALRLEVMRHLADNAASAGRLKDEEKWLRDYIQLLKASGAVTHNIGWNPYCELSNILKNHGRDNEEVEQLLKQGIELEELSGGHDGNGPIAQLGEYYERHGQWKEYDAMYDKLLESKNPMYDYDLASYMKTLRRRGLNQKADAVKKVGMEMFDQQNRPRGAINWFDENR